MVSVSQGWRIGVMRRVVSPKRDTMSTNFTGGRVAMPCPAPDEAGAWSLSPADAGTRAGLKRVPIVTSRCTIPSRRKNDVAAVSSLKPNKNGDAMSTPASTKSSTTCVETGNGVDQRRRPIGARGEDEDDHADDDRQCGRGAGVEAEQERRRDEQDRRRRTRSCRAGSARSDLGAACCAGRYPAKPESTDPRGESPPPITAQRRSAASKDTTLRLDRLRDVPTVAAHLAFILRAP